MRYRHADGTQASRTFRTKKDAERFYGQIKTEDGDFKGLTSQQRKITFGAYAAMWQRTKHVEHSMKTKVRRDQILRLHVLPQLGHMTIRSIRRQHLRDLIVNWEEINCRQQLSEPKSHMSEQYSDWPSMTTSLVKIRLFVLASRLCQRAKEPFLIKNNVRYCFQALTITTDEFSIRCLSQDCALANFLNYVSETFTNVRDSLKLDKAKRATE